MYLEIIILLYQNIPIFLSKLFSLINNGFFVAINTVVTAWIFYDNCCLVVRALAIGLGSNPETI
jgi:hypothetical protein